MAIADVLYACIECGRLEALRPAGDAEACERCATIYRRVEGARIQVAAPGRPAETRSAAQWLDMLSNTEPEPVGALPPEPVLVRIAETFRPHWTRGVYLGRIEDFGPETGGTLKLERDRLTFEGDTARYAWLLLGLTALQPSSRALQLKLRNGPLISVKFPQGSAVLWEKRVQRALQELYASLGRGRIVEFQPRIVTE